MNARHDDVFILRTVKNADISALRQGFIDAPHVIMILLLTCRLFEGDDLHAARIEARKDMIHRTVLAGRIHRLQDDDETVGILSIELFLKHLQFSMVSGKYLSFTSAFSIFTSQAVGKSFSEIFSPSLTR